MELFTALVLALQPVPAPTLTIPPPAMHEGGLVLAARRQVEPVWLRMPVPKRAPGWVKGGIIGGVAGVVALLGVTYAFDSIDHRGDAPYFAMGLSGAFGGFVIGGMIGGK